MPNDTVNKVTAETDLTKVEAEELWNKAKDIVEKQYKKRESHPAYFQLVMGVFKRSLGKNRLKQLKWTTENTMLDNLETLMLLKS